MVEFTFLCISRTVIDDSENKEEGNNGGHVHLPEMTVETAMWGSVKIKNQLKKTNKHRHMYHTGSISVNRTSGCKGQSSSLCKSTRGTFGIFVARGVQHHLGLTWICGGIRTNLLLCIRGQRVRGWWN